MEARHPVDHPRGHVSAGAGCATVRVDREHVGGAAEGADGYPATVLAETHVLNLDRNITDTEVRGQRVGAVG